MRNLLLLTLLCCGIMVSSTANAQQTVGLFMNSSEALDGYTLFAPIGSTTTYLINNCGEMVHSWPSENRPGLSCYLLENGTLLRSGRVSDEVGVVEMIDWDGNVTWSYSVAETHGFQHHDIEFMPNGNILLIVWDVRPVEELVAAGGSSNNEQIISEQIIEIQPDLVNGGATVVWEWRAWDHLIQDVDPAKANYGVVADNPQRIDINFLNHRNDDWLHANGVDYNAELDQIIVSVHNFSEFWIIDHSTSTEEAAGSNGGRYGKGGDILYRWGNPQAYDQGNRQDQKLFLQHNAYWIEDGFADAGKIMIFSNEAGTLSDQEYSEVHVMDPAMNPDGSYTFNNEAYLPADADWTYRAETPTDFFSPVISGAQRLENGNTLICQGVGGRMFEVNMQGETVWEYVNPVGMNGAVDQGSQPRGNSVFRCTRYTADYPALQGKALEPTGYIEPGSDFACDLFNGVSTDVELETTGVEFEVYPNPVSDFLNIRYGTKLTHKGITSLKIFTLTGNVVFATNRLKTSIDLSGMEAGSYFVQIRDGESLLTSLFVVQ